MESLVPNKIPESDFQIRCVYNITLPEIDAPEQDASVQG